MLCLDYTEDVRDRLLRAAVVVLVVVGGIAAVAKDRPSHEADDTLVRLVTAAPDTARERGTARMSMHIESSGAGPDVSIDAGGVLDVRSGAGVFRFGDGASAIEVRTDGRTVWVSVPEARRASTGGKPWAAAPLPATAQATTATPVSPASSFTGFLDVLRGRSTEMDDRGSEMVNGVMTHHVRAELRTAKALPPGSSVPAGLPDSLPMEVWVSDEGLPIRLQTEISLSVQGAGTVTVRFRFELSDFGVPVEVTPPPDDQVAAVPNASSLQALLQP